MNSNSILIVFFGIMIMWITGTGLEDLAKQIQQIDPPKTAVRATVTAYSSEESQTDNTPNVTAFMKKVSPGKVAVSWDLLEQGWTPGKCIWIERIGVRRVDKKYKINDLMNRKWEKRIDIWFHSRQDALNYGIEKDVLIVLLAECGDA